jgi:hypothetical protein
MGNNLRMLIQSKPCTHCGLYIIKNGGCNSVLCQRCLKEFQWAHGAETIYKCALILPLLIRFWNSLYAVLPEFMFVNRSLALGICTHMLAWPLGQYLAGQFYYNLPHHLCRKNVVEDKKSTWLLKSLAYWAVSYLVLEYSTRFCLFEFILWYK